MLPRESGESVSPGRERPGLGRGRRAAVAAEPWDDRDHDIGPPSITRQIHSHRASALLDCAIETDRHAHLFGNSRRDRLRHLAGRERRQRSHGRTGKQ
jgi:hypothetical protein